MDIFTLIALIDLLKQSGVVTDMQWLKLHEKLQESMNSGKPFVEWHNEIVEEVCKNNKDIELVKKQLLINAMPPGKEEVIKPVKKIILPGRG